MKKIFIFFVLFFPYTVSLASPEAETLLKNFQDQTMQILENQKQNFDSRKKSFLVILRKFFDIESVARFVLGRYKTTPEEWSHFLALFEDRLANLYASSFSSYNKESLLIQKIEEIQEGSQKGWLIRSQLLRDQDFPIAIEWVIFPHNNDLKILDIHINGCSLKMQQRDEYLSIIQREGGTIQGLLKFLNQSHQKK